MNRVTLFCVTLLLTIACSSEVEVPTDDGKQQDGSAASSMMGDSDECAGGHSKVDQPCTRGTTCPYNGLECHSGCIFVCTDSAVWGIECPDNLAECLCGRLPDEACCTQYPNANGCQDLFGGGQGGD